MPCKVSSTTTLVSASWSWASRDSLRIARPNAEVGQAALADLREPVDLAEQAGRLHRQHEHEQEGDGVEAEGGDGPGGLRAGGGEAVLGAVDEPAGEVGEGEAEQAGQEQAGQG